MTLLDDRPSVAAPAPQRPARSPFATWRFASRLARREVRRRPGRTLLVIALVVVPVAAMTFGSVMHRTVAQGDWAAEFGRRNGASDLAIVAPRDAPLDLSVLPSHASSITFVDAHTSIEGVDGRRFWSDWNPMVWFSDLPVDQPVAAGIVEVTRGRAPQRSDEVLLTQRVADFFDVDVGATLRLGQPAVDWEVTGIGRATDDHRLDIVLTHGFDRSRLSADATIRTLIDLGDGVDVTEARPTIDALEAQGAWVSNRWESEGGAGNVTAALAWGWVAGVLALVAVGIVIAAAFATSARRQLVTIGQLASNGAPPSLVRRTLVLQGSWTGAIGAVAGIAVAGIALVAARPLVEQVVGRSVGAYRLAPLHLLVIALTAIAAATVAAAVPARTAAGIPVLTALSGRRPLGTPSRRLAPVGAALFLGGLGLLAVAATGSRSGESADLFALVAVIGAVAVVFGMCCATPIAVTFVGRLGGAGGSGTWRLATRSTARSRSRSAGVITAVATAGAFAVAGATIAGTTLEDRITDIGFPYNSVQLERWDDVYADDPVMAVNDDGSGAIIDPPPPAALDLPDAMRDEIVRVLPDAAWIPVRSATFDPRPFDPDDPDHQALYWVQETGRVAVVADEALIERIGLSAADRALLDQVDVVSMGDWYGFGEAGELVVSAETGDITLTTAVAVDGSAGWFENLVSPTRAEAAGFEIVETGALVLNPANLTNAERNTIHQIVHGDQGWPSVFVEPDGGEPVVDRTSTGISAMTRWQPTDPPALLVNAIIVAAAVLLTLLVVAIGLSLSATESRDERDVLVAVGAPPRTLSRVAGAKAVVLAGTGVVLAVPTGFLPIWVVYETVTRVGESGAVFPWRTILVLVVTVPTVAGLAAWVTSSIARRLRPVRMSTVAAD